MPGYSKTPLAVKLGFRDPMRVLLVDAPEEYASWVAPLPEGITLSTDVERPIRAAHVFALERCVLEAWLRRLRGQLTLDGFVWASWPKKTAKVATDVTENSIRAIALPLGFVDVKVCAVSEVWSGLKLVIRKSERR